MARVSVHNPADGGFVFWLLRFYLFGLISSCLVFVAAAFFALLWISSQVPPLDRFRDFRRTTPLTTRMLAWDGQVMAEFAEERRQLVELEAMPNLLVSAFLVAEDRRFSQHHGLDVRGIVRAAWTNLRAGTVVQGGSTITQQVAKAFLGPERTLTRKLREALLALKLEFQFTKDEILYFYLNTIFLGHGSYGVAAASERYFGKELSRLSVDQMALLAGLARAPARYSPITHPDRALSRRDVVLELMRDAKLISQEQWTAAKSQRLQLQPAQDFYRERAPSFSEYVRRIVMNALGAQTFYRGGLTVETSADLELMALASENVDFALRKLDKRQGWRGPVAHLATENQRRALVARSVIEYPEGPIDPERPYLALVEQVTAKVAELRIGPALVKLGYSGLSWAAPYSARDPTNDRPALSVPSVLHPGDVVWVKAKTKSADVTLEQTPRIEGALLTFDHETGYELAHLGGRDFDQSSFDRVAQACRQPGSTYKPIYYSLALDGRYAMNTVLQDKPYVPEPGEEWNPRNIHGTLDGRVTLWAALVRSLNLPSIQLLSRVGPKNAADWARRLGFTTPIHADRALALGASCTRLSEMARAFAIFARGGTRVDLIPIRRVLDRHGRVLIDHAHPNDPWLDPASRLDRIAATIGQTPRQVIDPRTAYLTSRLLRDAVQYGIAARAGTIGAPTAGKGGTSSDTMDVSFIGYTSRWVTAAWVGDDKYERPLGAEDASYSIVIPLWARYMKDAIGSRPHQEIPWQNRPSGISSIEVDPATGEPPEPGALSIRMLVKN